SSPRRPASSRWSRSRLSTRQRERGRERSTFAATAHATVDEDLVPILDPSRPRGPALLPCSPPPKQAGQRPPHHGSPVGGGHPIFLGAVVIVVVMAVAAAIDPVGNDAQHSGVDLFQLLFRLTGHFLGGVTHPHYQEGAVQRRSQQ